MNSYDNSTVAKNLLLQLESYVKALSQRGPTDLTVYLENFATKLMEAYYGYSFVNMNYISKNIAGIDLLNKEENHGIQFTIENNNSRKVIDSIKNAKSYNKVTVFFFDHNSVKTIVNNIQKKGEWKDNLEVISLFDIFDMIETDAEKANKFREICNLWIDGNTTLYSDLTNKLNNETKKRIESNIRSKKYIPEIYIPENKLKKECRFFADPFWATEFFLRKTPTYFKGFCYEQIKKCNVKLKDGTNISFERDCDVSGFYKEIYPELYMDDILGKLKNYMIMTESVRNGVEFYNEKGHQLTINETSATLENGIYFTISNDVKLYEYSKKKFFFIVKDAGQGKTNFLCDFSKNILLKRKTPSIYINVNELTKNLLATIKEQISLSVGKTYEDSFNLLQQYCYSINKSLIICIDGLNEKNNLSEFKNEVLELFRFADRYNFIKIIATSRNKAYQTYFKDFKTESFGDLIVENIEEFRGHYGRKSDEFKRKIFEKYRNYFNVSCYISSVAKNNLVNDTLLLRIFCEVYENNTEAIINDIFLYELFHFYIKKRSTQLLKAGKLKRDEDLISLLLKISQKMIFTHNLNDFSYDGFTSEEKDLLDIIVQEDIIIKSSDENGIALFGEKTSFSF